MAVSGMLSKEVDARWAGMPPMGMMGMMPGTAMPGMPGANAAASPLHGARSPPTSDPRRGRS